VLGAIRILGLDNYVKYYQASTAELYGDVVEKPRDKEARLIVAVNVLKRISKSIISDRL
jgi:GDP-D-mannose dehydratase